MGATQQALIPLTDEDVKARAKILARLIGELKTLREDHAEQKKAMNAEEQAVERRVNRIARSIREGAEDPTDTGE
jgi:hypothetical protein